MLKSIQEEWEVYSAMIFDGMKVPPSAVQIKETKQAFFAGAWAILCGLNICGSQFIPEEEGVKWLSERRDECEDFMRQIMRDYAEGN